MPSEYVGGLRREVYEKSVSEGKGGYADNVYKVVEQRRKKKKSSGGGSSSNSMTVSSPTTEPPPVNDIKKASEELNKKAALLEEYKQKAEKGKTDAIRYQYTLNYNNLLQSYNPEVEAYNKQVYKTRAAVDFANLYPEDKAAEIVEASGVKQNIISEVSYIPKADGGGSSSQSPGGLPSSSANRFVYDKTSGLWEDTSVKPNNALRVEPLQDRTAVERFKNYLSFKSEEYSRKGITALDNTADPLGPLKAVNYLGSAAVYGFYNRATDLVTKNPVESVLLPIVQTVVNPKETAKVLSYSLYKDPGGTIGSFGPDIVLIKGVPRAYSKISGAVSEYRFNKGVVIDKDFVFTREGTSAVSPDGTVLPETQTFLYDKNVYTDIGKTSSPSSLKPFNTEIQTPLSYTNEGGFFTDRYSPNIQKITLESGKTVTTSRPTPQEVLRVERINQESALKGSAKQGTQTDLLTSRGEILSSPLKEIKPIYNEIFNPNKPGFFSLVKDKIGLEPTPFYKAFEPSSRIYSGGPVSATVEIAGKLFSKFDEGRTVSRLTPEVTRKTSFDVASKNEPINYFGLTTTTALLRGQEAQFTPNIKTPGNSFIPKENPIIKGGKPLYKVDTNSIYDIKSALAEKTKSDVFIISKNKSGQRIDQAQDLGQDQSLKQDEDVIPPPPPPPPPDYKGGGGPPPPIIIKPIPTFKPKYQDSRSSVEGYNVLVRKKGLFRQANPTPLSREQALNFGLVRVGNTSAASFKLEKAGREARGQFLQEGRITDFYRKGPLYIEKPSRRIKSAGEKAEITFKGLDAKRLKKKLGGNKIKWGF